MIIKTLKSPTDVDRRRRCLIAMQETIRSLFSRIEGTKGWPQKGYTQWGYNDIHKGHFCTVRQFDFFSRFGSYITEEIGHVNHFYRTLY